MNTFIWLYLLLVDLGYIPRTTNVQFCALMDQGYSDMFEARIQRITPDSHMEHQVGVIVYLKKA